MNRFAILAILTFCCSSLHSQYYSRDEAGNITAEDVPNIVGYLAAAKELLSADLLNDAKTIPAARIELLYLDNLKDTSLLYSRIEGAESLKNVAEFYPDHDFVEDVLVYKSGGHNDYNMGEWKSYSSMITLAEEGTDTHFIDNRTVTFLAVDEGYSVLIMDKVVLSESRPLDKLLYRYKVYADSILSPKRAKKDSTLSKVRKEKWEKLSEIKTEQHLIRKATDYYDNAVKSGNYTREERLEGVPLKRLLEEDPVFVKMLNEGYAFAKDYATSSAKFNQIIKPLLTHEEYYGMHKLLGVPKINKGACDFDDKMARAAYLDELILRAFQADRHRDFFRMYKGVLNGTRYYNSTNYFKKLDSFGLEAIEFVIGMAVATADRRLSINEIACQVANGNNDEAVIQASTKIVSDPAVDDYNKYNLTQMMGMIIGYTSKEERKTYLKAKYGIEEINVHHY